jgi:hypothetical protein
MIDGVKIDLGGGEWIVPPLNLRTLEKFYPVIESWTQPRENALDYLREVAEFIHAALVRNYPDLTLDDVKDLVDLKNVQMVIPAILEASGFARGAGEGQGDPLGETTPPLTGERYTVN